MFHDLSSKFAQRTLIAFLERLSINAKPPGSFRQVPFALAHNLNRFRLLGGKRTWGRTRLAPVPLASLTLGARGVRLAGRVRRLRLQYSFKDGEIIEQRVIDQHDQSLRQRSQGIDYRQVTPSRRWSFGDFVQTLAQLLGRRGGLSAFTSDELEALGKLYPRVDCTEALLRQAVEQSPEKTIPAIAFQLQRRSDGQATTEERKTQDAGPGPGPDTKP